MTGWNVYGTKPGTNKRQFLDTVFYDDKCDAEYVRRGLIDHDGYPSDITVRRQVKPTKEKKEG